MPVLASAVVPVALKIFDFAWGRSLLLLLLLLSGMRQANARCEREAPMASSALMIPVL